MVTLSFGKMNTNAFSSDIHFCIPSGKLKVVSARPAVRADRPLVRSKTTGDAAEILKQMSLAKTGAHAEPVIKKPAVSRLLELPQADFRHRSASMPSTGPNRRHWLTKLRYMKDDIDLRLKKASRKILIRRSNSHESQVRRMKVELISGKSPKKSSPRRATASEHLNQANFPCNFTSRVILTGLKNGTFGGELPLDSVPQGDLTIKVHNSKLFILVKAKCAEQKDSKHKSKALTPCGFVELPIFVDPTTLQLELTTMENSDVLSIAAKVKGFVDHGQYLSVNQQEEGRFRDRTASLDPAVINNLSSARKLSRDFRDRCNSR